MEAIVDYSYRNSRVYIYLKEGNTFWGYDGSNLIEYKAKPYEFPSEEILPFLIIPVHFASIILKALAEAAKKNGISTENENRLKGKMEAIKDHLVDMREFAKVLLEAQTEKKVNLSLKDSNKGKE